MIITPMLVVPVVAMLIAVAVVRRWPAPYKGRHVLDDGLAIFQPERHPNCRSVLTPVHPHGLIGAARDQRNLALSSPFPDSLGTMLGDVHAGGTIEDDQHGMTFTAGEDLHAGDDVTIDPATGTVTINRDGLYELRIKRVDKFVHSGDVRDLFTVADQRARITAIEVLSHSTYASQVGRGWIVIPALMMAQGWTVEPMPRRWGATSPCSRAISPDQNVRVLLEELV